MMDVKPIPLPVEQRPQEVKRIEAWSNWPYFPWLPIKRSHEGVGSPQAALITAHALTRVYVANLFDRGQYAEKARGRHGREQVTVGEVLAEMPVLEEYESVAAMVDDGWRND